MLANLTISSYNQLNPDFKMTEIAKVILITLSTSYIQNLYISEL